MSIDMIVLCSLIWGIGTVFAYGTDLLSAIRNSKTKKAAIFMCIAGLIICFIAWPLILGVLIDEDN